MWIKYVLKMSGLSVGGRRCIELDQRRDELILDSIGGCGPFSLSNPAPIFHARVYDNPRRHQSYMERWHGEQDVTGLRDVGGVCAVVIRNVGPVVIFDPR